MPELSAGETKVLLRCIERFDERFGQQVVEVVRRELRGFEPVEITELLGELSLLRNQLQGGHAQIHATQTPLVKRMLIDLRRAAAAEAEAPLLKATTTAAVRHVRREVYVLEQLMDAPWFAEATAMRVPRLTDYLTIRHAEAALPHAAALRAREFDEKFHILEAPGLFLADVAYYRARGALRDAPVSVAYLDIDDFKAFNTRHTEAVVDLNLLPAFMECLEAHVFARGHAYRFGGDEYVLLLPNETRATAAESLRALQARLARQRYRRIDPSPTVSIGLCSVDGDSFLTDREVLARANVAKNHAKVTRKGGIATFAGELFREADLVLL